MNLLRSDLYRLVWSHPGVRVADLLGISSSALTRVCKRLDVPAPARGHWRRLEVGQSIARPALPEGCDTPLRFVINDELAELLSELPTAAEIPTKVPAAQKETCPVPKSKFSIKKEDAAVCPPDREGTESRQACDPAPVLVEVLSGPSLGDLVALSHQHQLLQEFAGFIQSLEDLLPTQPAPVASVLALWIHRAKAVMQAENPVEQVLDGCRRASWRELPSQARKSCL